MTPPAPNDLPRELLAGYADKELDPAARAAVEQWLADHPAARDEVQAQRELSRDNTRLWERAEPPAPSESRWLSVRSEIERELSAPPPSRRWRAGAWAIAGLTAAGVAAAVAWIALGPAIPRQQKGDAVPVELAKALPNVAPAPREIEHAAAPHSIDPLAEFAMLPMATDDDVILERVPEFPAGWLPVGRHPLQGIMSLATVEELLLAEVTPSSAYPPGGPKMTTAPGDAPMIFAPKLR